MKTNRITKYEQETIILWNKGEDTASVFTYEPTLKKRVAKFAREHPDIARFDFDNGSGGIAYLIDKSRISIRFTAPYSEERREAASKLAKQNGIASKNF